MFAGFDYGSSNCAIGVLHADSPALLPLYKDQQFVPSALYALSRELICDYVARHISCPQQQADYMAARSNQLRLATASRRELDIAPGEETIFVGEEAVESYIDFPDEGYFVKSPKSFLGVSGLRPEHQAFFEDIVTAMMMQLKQGAETQLGHPIRQTVIGRPVNFQGRDGEQANKQACHILHTAARRAGFEAVELLYEPIAAGINFEQTLTENRLVLVVDIGGGTTDCSMVCMGPDHRSNNDRSADFLGHSGARVGGNDLDIHLACHGLMPELGLGGTLRSGRPLPSQPYWDAVSINDIPAQTRFNSLENIELMAELGRDAAEPEKVKRLLQLQQRRQNYQLVRSAEQSKIALSDQDTHTASLAYIDNDLATTLSSSQYAQAVERPVCQVIELMQEVMQQAQCQPDLIYITGGTSRSPVVRKAITQLLGNIPVISGDHFGSVTAGLTQHAAQLYR
ncbi:MAG: molecular chaperone [Marinobacterium sp.]|nr:molecular chaperone [Marinobacterium sp.]